MTRTTLEGKKIAILATDGFEQSELEIPMQRIRETGGEVELVSLKTGSIVGYHHFDKGRTIKVDTPIEEAECSDYDGLVLPGGVFNPDQLRMNKRAVDFVRDFDCAGEPIAAIYHGPWTLINAGIAKGRTLTSWPSLKVDIENVGGKWVDQEVHVDRGVVTSRKPDDLDAFCRTAIEEFHNGATHSRAQ
jgi:protease I